MKQFVYLCYKTYSEQSDDKLIVVDSWDSVIKLLSKLNGESDCVRIERCEVFKVD